MFPRLPELPPQLPSEDVQAYGARALCFLLSTSCTATLDDRSLQLAEYAAMRAVAAPDCSLPALRTLSELRHVIASALKYRASAPDVTSAPAPALPAPAPPAASDGGMRVLVTPQLPKPAPPAGRVPAPVPARRQPVDIAF